MHSIFCLQNENFEGDDPKKVIAEKMRHFLQDSSRDVQEPYFTVSEFIDWLFSRENQVFDAVQVWNTLTLGPIDCLIPIFPSEKLLIYPISNDL